MISWPAISILNPRWWVVLEGLGDFIFSIRFTIKEGRFIQSIPKLLGLELDALGGSSGRIHDLQVLDDGKGNVTIQVRADDMAGLKIAANSINRYIEIVGKVVEMVKKGPTLPNSLSNGS